MSEWVSEWLTCSFGCSFAEASILAKTMLSKSLKCLANFSTFLLVASQVMHHGVCTCFIIIKPYKIPQTRLHEHKLLIHYLQEYIFGILQNQFIKCPSNNYLNACSLLQFTTTTKTQLSERQRSEFTSTSSDPKHIHRNSHYLGLAVIWSKETEYHHEGLCQTPINMEIHRTISAGLTTNFLNTEYIYIYRTIVLPLCCSGSDLTLTKTLSSFRYQKQQPDRCIANIKC